jgi:hypothetical protein
MVTPRRLAPRGTSRIGCLVSLALFAAALYYGIEVGRMYWRYYELRDEMARVARLAPNTSDEAIRRTLLSRIEALGLPDEARRVVVRRSGPPSQIHISTEYRETLHLPFGSARHITFRPRVEQFF